MKRLAVVIWALSAGMAMATTHDCTMGNETVSANVAVRVAAPHGMVYPVNDLRRLRRMPKGWRPLIEGSAEWAGATYSVSPVHANIAEVTQTDPPGPSYWMRFAVNMRGFVFLQGPIGSEDKVQIRCRPIAAP